MDLYAGLDVSLNETSLCIIDSEGKIVRESKVPSEPEAIRSAFEGYADRLGRLGIEASSLGIWLHRELTAAGPPAIVVEARHMRASLSAMRNKTDRNDTRGIAQMMRMGWYRAVYVKGVETQRMRTLLANRPLLKRKLIDLENHIRGALRAYGLRVGQVSRGNFEDRVRELMEHADYVFEVMIATLLEVRRTVLEGYNKLHKIVLQVVIHDPLCRRFMAVPGVGPIAALTFKVAVEDPRRFARGRTVGAYFGLTPRRHQSGISIDFTGHISKMGDINARGALCEAAATLLLRSRRWSALKAWGMRIAKRQSMMCAIVAVARKLAAILHRMWIDGSEFQWTAGAKVIEKVRLKSAKA
ncbi:MAG TPA: IS110 family transposase [Stellaceae bacterium]|nr:IS110 family transposase [Stellaceae bacterium]